MLAAVSASKTKRTLIGQECPGSSDCKKVSCWSWTAPACGKKPHSKKSREKHGGWWILPTPGAYKLDHGK